MARTPTDLQILDLIFEHHLPDYLRAPHNDPVRQHKSYVPVDLEYVANFLGIDLTLLTSRLLDHLDKKYRYQVEKDSYVFLFSSAFGRGARQDQYVVNFPYLSSIIAGMRDDSRKYRIATSMAGVSLVISVTSFLISVLGR
ncbi:hypothetical protein BTA51_18100 [Hahella sp. CCB-MM4]|uniref:hypothetical protein n=1 Tax=Hahella sp. (strain CCB-MM4) TaxID=1926491 RepID=UPI000B9C0D3D|nr:hypothetical protein [Hahella sp. CCB-MM4]OZG71919.1 hypothetical protein BTA51_18100 [Hahella sp. CCB-MM4]